MQNASIANNINYKTVYLAVIISIIFHTLIAITFISKSNASVYMDNGLQAFDRPRVSLSISKINSIKKVEPKIEDTKPAPASPPLEKVQQVVKEDIIEETAQDNKAQEPIPVVENATFKGKRSPPIYPKRALMLKQEGVVLLKALIGKTGDIKDIQIITSSGYTILDKSAIKAVSKWKFEPSYINGTPSLSWVKVPVEFIIK